MTTSTAAPGPSGGAAHRDGPRLGSGPPLQVALIDELAHTHVPGARNTMRWHNVDELLESKISEQALTGVDDSPAPALTGVAPGEAAMEVILQPGSGEVGGRTDAVLPEGRASVLGGVVNEYGYAA
ncbi:hypothetical protein [Streptomyces sparsogenes]|uniref:hypothetical protein n=1 Tax=Streptomyces sparsogenes TaxID=67365 RepID=UPI0033EB2CBE